MAEHCPLNDFKTSFLSKTSRGITGYIKGRPLNGFEIISLIKNSDNFELKFKILRIGDETKAGSYCLIMLKNASILGDSVNVLYKLSIKKISPNKKPENIINAVVTKSFCVDRNTNLDTEYMGRFWNKLLKLSKKFSTKQPLARV